MHNRFTFRKATSSDKTLIHTWWNKPHVKEFWDNSPECWKNVENYLDKEQKDLFDYWLGFYDGTPFSLIMTCNETQAEGTPSYYLPHLSTQGDTLTIDFMIGDETYLGKGLAHLTLRAFMAFCSASVTNFLIDPASDNPRAAHVYQQAGFQEVARFTREGGYFAGKEHIIMRYNRDKH